MHRIGTGIIVNQTIDRHSRLRSGKMLLEHTANSSLGVFASATPFPNATANSPAITSAKD